MSIQIQDRRGRVLCITKKSPTPKSCFEHRANGGSVTPIFYLAPKGGEECLQGAWGVRDETSMAPRCVGSGDFEVSGLPGP